MEILCLSRGELGLGTDLLTLDDVALTPALSIRNVDETLDVSLSIQA